MESVFIFAGPICEGASCIGFTFLVILSAVTPVVIGLWLLWLISGYFIRRHENKSFSTVSSSKSTLIKLGIIVVASSIAVFFWLFPKSEYWQNRQRTNNSKIVIQKSILLPYNIEPTKIDLAVDPKYSSKYATKTTLTDKKAIIELLQDDRGIDMSNYDGGLFRCKVIPTKTIKYCYKTYENGSGSYYYVVETPEADVSIEFPPNYQFRYHRDFIQSLEPTILKKHENIIVLQDYYGRRF